MQLRFPAALALCLILPLAGHAQPADPGGGASPSQQTADAGPPPADSRGPGDKDGKKILGQQQKNSLIQKCGALPADQQAKCFTSN